LHKENKHVLGKLFLTLIDTIFMNTYYHIKGMVDYDFTFLTLVSV